MVDAALDRGRGGRLVGVALAAPSRPLIVDQAIRSIESPTSELTAERAWEQRDAGRWDVWAFGVDGRFVGVVVLCLTDLPIGRSLDLIGVKFVPGRWTRMIWPWFEDLAKRHGCKGIRGWSDRPIHRLPGHPEGVKVLETTFWSPING